MPQKKLQIQKRLFKKLIEVGFPTVIGFLISVAMANPNWSFLDLNMQALMALLIIWLILLAFRDIYVDKNYTQTLQEFEDEIYNTRNVLEMLETIPADRSKKLARLLNTPAQITRDNLLEEFLQSNDGIDKIIESVTEYLSRRTEAGEDQSFRASFALPTGDGSELMIAHSFSKGSRRPALQQVFSAQDEASKGTTAVAAWTNKTPIAIPDVEAAAINSLTSSSGPKFRYLNEDEKPNIKSILCVPIVSTDGPDGQENHGLLSIDTNERGYFEEIDVMEEYRWCKILTPFTARIAFYCRLSKASETALGNR